MAVSRFFMSQVAELARDVSAFGGPVALILIALLTRPELWFGLVLGLIGLEAVGRTIKILRFTPRPRPVAYRTLLEKSDAGGFPSIHSARSSFVCLTLAATAELTVHGTLYVTIPVAVGLSRLALARHRWIDVAGGWALGGLAALAWRWVMR